MCPCQNEGLAVLSKVSLADQERWVFPSAQHWWGHTPSNSSNSYTGNHLQEKPRHTGASPVVEYQDDQRTWEPLRWGETMRAGIVQPGKEEIWDHLNNLWMSSEADWKCSWTVWFEERVGSDVPSNIYHSVSLCRVYRKVANTYWSSSYEQTLHWPGDKTESVSASPITTGIRGWTTFVWWNFSRNWYPSMHYHTW